MENEVRRWTLRVLGVTPVVFVKAHWDNVLFVSLGYTNQFWFIVWYLVNLYVAN